jgi:hypothetical protein
MSQKKTATAVGGAANDWGYDGSPQRTPEEYAELARATRLRTLNDMSEREIQALEREYGCPVIRPQRRVRRRRSTVQVAA